MNIKTTILLLLAAACAFSQGPKFHSYVSPDRSLWIGASGDTCTSALLYDLSAPVSHTVTDIENPDAHKRKPVIQLGEKPGAKEQEERITALVFGLTGEKVTDWRKSALCKAPTGEKK